METNSIGPKEFWIRSSIWAVLACFAPVAFIAWRYKLFSLSEGSHLAISGWGFLAIVILFAFAIAVVRYLKAGLPYSMAVQCVDGFCKVILPLGALLLIVISIKDNIGYFEQALTAVIVCEAAAIPVNPFPKWVAQSKAANAREAVEGAFESLRKGRKRK